MTTAVTLTVAEALERAAEARDRGDAAEAERLYVAILDAQPRHTDTLLAFGGLLLGQARPDAALAALDALLGHHPDHPDALRNRGLALQALGRMPAARMSFRRVLALAPDHAPTLHDLDLALMAEGRPARRRSSPPARSRSPPTIRERMAVSAMPGSAGRAPPLRSRPHVVRSSSPRPRR